MLDVIEKLLILQDRDKKISRVETELGNISPERAALQGRVASAQHELDTAKAKAMQIESNRKKLELEVEAKKQQIQKYSVQQFQTKKNEEYRALANEIENCKTVIRHLEDQQLEMMEKGEQVQREVITATQAAKQAKIELDRQVADIAQREEALRSELAQLRATHQELVNAVDTPVLNRYQRLRKQKGPNSVVGIEHSVCGGCHMKLPVQIVISCQGQKEMISCPNCGRILYYNEDMDLAVVD